MSRKLSRRDMLKMSGAGVAALMLASRGLLGRAQTEQAFNLKYPSWQWGEAGVGDWNKARAEELQAMYPHITVEQIQIASRDFETTILTQLAAGDAPDLLPAFTFMLPRLISEGLLEPLDAWLAAAPFKDAILPSVSIAQKNGMTYGLPMTMSPQGLIYNQKLMDEAGIQMVPTTVEELYEAAKIIKEKTGAWGYAAATNTADVLWSYIVTMQWIIGFGSDWSQPDGTITANAQPNKDALTWLQKFLNEGLSPQGFIPQDLRNLFAEGQVAFTIDGPWVLTNVKARNPELYPLTGYAPSPTPTRAGITGGAFYSIPADAEHKEEAWRLLEIMFSEENQRKYVEETVQVAGTNVEVSEAFLEENPWYPNVGDVAAKYAAGIGYLAPGYELYPAEFRKIAIDHVALIWSGQQSVEDALDQAQRTFEAWAASL